MHSGGGLGLGWFVDFPNRPASKHAIPPHHDTGEKHQRRHEADEVRWMIEELLHRSPVHLDQSSSEPAARATSRRSAAGAPTAVATRLLPIVTTVRVGGCPHTAREVPATAGERFPAPSTRLTKKAMSVSSVPAG